MSTDASNEPKSDDTTALKTSTKTVYKSDAEQIHDSTNDWKDDKEYPGTFYSKKLNLLWCPNHKICTNRGGMSRHFRSKHGEMKTITRRSSLETQLEDVDKPSIVVIQTPEEMVLEDHNREVAEAAGMLAKDYELRAEYEMLHQQDRIPYDWSFYDWIKLGTVVNWNEKWKVNLSLNQDVGLLDDKQREWLRLTLAENEQKRKAETEVIIE